MTPGDGRVVCLGEAIVDLICEKWLEPGEQAGPFVAHHGGAPANVAAVAAGNGVSTCLVGGVGSDRWGEWLLEGLARSGVETGWLVSVDGVQSPVAFATFDRLGEPTFEVYGEDIGPLMAASEPMLESALDGASALAIGTNTMVGDTEREVTRRAVAIARELSIPVLLDPNHRPGRWTDQQTGADFARELVGLSTLVKANRAEAELITGVAEPDGSAEAMLELGPEVVVITNGDGPVICRGSAWADFEPEPVDVVSPLGAGDAFLGSLIAGLDRCEWDLAKTGDLLREACAEAGRACRVWGARP
jgi:sugar/nucleoside kinase (ribokinase family)